MAEQTLPMYSQPFKLESADFSRVLEALAEATGGSVDIFKLNQLRVPSGGGMQWQTKEGYVTTLQGVIVHHHPIRSYWSESFGTRQAAPPDCQSFDGLHGYGNPGGRCVDPATRAPICPFAEFGTKPASSPKGTSRAPACKNAYALYIVTPQAALPLVFLAPGVSINPVRAYLRDLATQGFFARDVVTEFSLEQTRNAEGILFSRAVLKAVGRTTETLQEALKACATTLRETLQAQAAFLQAYSPSALPSAAQTVEERQASVARVESSLTVGAGGLMFHDAPEDDDIADPPVPVSQHGAGPGSVSPCCDTGQAVRSAE